MHLTSDGLERIEQEAVKKRSADTLLLIQLLQEVRELKEILDLNRKEVKPHDPARNPGKR